MHSQFFHFELDFMQFSKQPFAAFLNGDFLLILQYRSARFCLLFFLNESVPSEPLCRVQVDFHYSVPILPQLRFGVLCVMPCLTYAHCQALRVAILSCSAWLCLYVPVSASMISFTHLHLLFLDGSLL